MKKLTFLMAILFAGVMVFGQNPNEAFVNQIAPGLSTINISQVGDGNLIGGPGTVVDALGTSQSAALQIAGVASTFAFCQIGDDNTGLVKQESWNGTRDAILHWQQHGNDNIMKMNQSGKYDVEAYGQQIGNENVFAGLSSVGASCDLTSSMGVDDTKYASQIDVWNDAFIDLLQRGNGNEAGLYQYNGALYTQFDLKQIGDNNKLVGYQHNDASSHNLMDVTQLGNGYEAACFQKNTGDGGNNFAIFQH